MSSVISIEKANNWSSIYASALAREKQDEDNIHFMDIREQAARQETQEAKEYIKTLEARKKQLETTVARVNRLERTDVEFWEDGDMEFFLQLEGIKIFSFTLFYGKNHLRG